MLNIEKSANKEVRIIFQQMQINQSTTCKYIKKRKGRRFESDLHEGLFHSLFGFKIKIQKLFFSSYSINLIQGVRIFLKLIQYLTMSQSCVETLYSILQYVHKMLFLGFPFIFLTVFMRKKIVFFPPKHGGEKSGKMELSKIRDD